MYVVQLCHGVLPLTITPSLLREFNLSLSDSTISNEFKKDSYIVTSPIQRIYLVISPQLPTRFISNVLCTVLSTGYHLIAARRLRLDERKSSALNIPQRSQIIMTLNFTVFFIVLFTTGITLISARVLIQTRRWILITTKTCGCSDRPRYCLFQKKTVLYTKAV